MCSNVSSSLSAKPTHGFAPGKSQGICSHSLSWWSVGLYLVCTMLLACCGWLRYLTETQPGDVDDVCGIFELQSIQGPVEG